MRRAQAPAQHADALADAVLTASRLLVSISIRSIAAVEDVVTVAQFRMLVILDTRGSLNLASLADHLGVNPSTANRMVNRLVATDMVVREASPLSRREILIRLTSAGERLVREVTDLRRADISRIVARMPANTRERLVEALTAFAVAGGEPLVTTAADAGPDSARS